MLTAAARDLIGKFPLGFVATVTAGGRPSLSPKGTFLVLDDRKLAFGEIRSPGTMANLNHLPELEVNFIDLFKRKGLRVRGTTTILERGSPEFGGLIGLWQDKWGELAGRINALVSVHVTSVQAMATPPYDDGATEQEMIALYKSIYAEIYP